MADSVRAAVLAAPGRYELQEFPYPRLADGALLMQVEMVGICGTDKHTYAGETKQYAGTPAETDTPFPIVQGHENVGVVAEITPTAAERIVLHMANTPKSFVEGIEMLKRGGMMLEMGNFADTGEISLNVHRHVCSKNIRLIGLTNHPSTGYGPALRLLERYADRYPFAEMVTHEFGLHQADEALHTSIDPRSMKVAIVPGLTT